MSFLTRRSFVRASGAAALAPAALSRAARTGTDSNDRIRVALIGAGGRGRADLTAFLTNPEADCAVVCDVDDRQIAAGCDLVEKTRGKRPDAEKDFRRVLDRKDVDACLIGTPDHWHALQTILACQAGKDVYVEKPLATTIGEGRAMVEAARRYRRVVQMGTQWRNMTHCQEAIEFVHSGKLGQIRQVRAWAYMDSVGGIGRPPDRDPPPGVDYDMWLGPAPKRPFNPNRFHSNFRWFWDYAGGLTTDWGVHLLNVALWGMGHEPPGTICSVGRKYLSDDNTETPDAQVVVYEFPAYQLIWDAQMRAGLGPNGRPHGVTFSGTEAALTVDNRGWEVVPEPSKPDLSIKRNTNSKELNADPTRAHVRDFLECVRTRRDPLMSMEPSHLATTVAHLGNIDLRTQSRLSWNSRTESIQDNQAASSFLRREYRAPWALPSSNG